MWLLGYSYLVRPHRVSDQTAYGKIHLPEIVKWAQKIEDLLGTHVIVSSDGKTIVLCVLRDAGRDLTTTTMIIEHRPV